MPTVIVAIPAPDDYVWKISSEKVPHMTVLFLDDLSAEQAAHITDFMQHVADMSLRRFGLSVDRRGKLGPDDADVIFFEDSYGFLKEIKDAREYLLKDEVIAKAVAAVEQYPQWTPHLTLGYPTAPAHEDNRDYPGINWVNFDRLALWTTDFEGFEIPLKSDDRMALSMTDQLNAALAHYGIKGMQWGRRKAGTGKASTHVKKGSEDHEKSRELNAKKPRDLSNSELKALNNRLQLERSHKDLTRTTSNFNKGHDKVKAVLAVAATAQAAYTFANSPMGKQIAGALKKAATKS